MSSPTTPTDLPVTAGAAHHSDPGPTPWQHLVGMAFGLTAALCVLVIAFVWPATSMAPHEVPIVVAGPPAAAEQVQATLDSAHPGAFDVTGVADEAAARAAIGDRDAYGAIVFGQPAHGADGIRRVAARRAAAQPDRDRVWPGRNHGTGRLGGGRRRRCRPAIRVGSGWRRWRCRWSWAVIAVGVAMARAVRGVSRSVIGTVGVASLAGLALAGIAHGWFGVLDGNYWAEAGTIALGIGSVALALIGLNAVLGVRGIALGGAVIMLLGNPLSGITSAPEMLPTPWGQLGQWLPPGAAGSLLRSVSFFGGAGGWGPFWILVGYAVGGVLLAWAAARRSVRPTHRRCGRADHGRGAARPDLTRVGRRGGWAYGAPMSAPPRVFVAGPVAWNLLVDVGTLPRPEPHMTFARGFRETLGGTSAGKALNLARLGAAVTLRTVVGRDEQAGRALADLQAAGVDVIAEVDPHGSTERHVNLMADDGGRVSIYLTMPALPDPPAYVGPDYCGHRDRRRRGDRPRGFGPTVARRGPRGRRSGMRRPARLRRSGSLPSRVRGRGDLRLPELGPAA